MTNYQHKKLRPRCAQGPESASEIRPGTKCKRKAHMNIWTSYAHSIHAPRPGSNRLKAYNFLYFWRYIHFISPTFLKLIFKTVNGSCVDNIIRKAASVFYISVIEKNLTYCCFEGWFFQFEIMSSSYEIMISCTYLMKLYT